MKKMTLETLKKAVKENRLEIVEGDMYQHFLMGILGPVSRHYLVRNTKTKKTYHVEAK